jgi:hypothetical protein
MSEQAQRWCPDCERNVLATRPGVNHTFHLLMCVFTCACWLWVWVLLSLFNVGGWMCPRCGSSCDSSVSWGSVLGVLLGLPFAFIALALFVLFVIPDHPRPKPAVPAAAEAAEPEPVQPGPPLPPTRAEEADAAAHLRYAKSLIQADNAKAARKELQTVIGDFPDTKAAPEAKELLVKLGKE